MSIDKTRVVAEIVDRLVNKEDMTLGVNNKPLIISTMIYYEDGSPEVMLPINCAKDRIVLNRVLSCVGSEKALYKKGGLFLWEYNQILIESNSAFTPNGKKKDIKKLIEGIMNKNSDMVSDEVLEAILNGGEEAMPAVV